MSGTPSVYRDCQRAKREYEDMSASLWDAKAEDEASISEEAVLVGFPEDSVEITIGHHHSNISIGFDVTMRNSLINQRHMFDPHRHWCICKIDGSRKKIDAELIAEHAFTPAQVFFLEWSCEWVGKISEYWEGRTAFNSIEEFNEDLKQNAERVYGSSPDVKSASKK